MKRRVAFGRGFWISLILNMAFRWEWAALAVVMLALHYLLDLPLLLVWICLGLWVLISLMVTLVVSMVSSGASEVPPTPGSKRASERIGKNHKN
jgi:hypothetical protein